MRVLITGGGTGGHIYPAIAIANKIKERVNHAEILFVGTRKGLESQLVPKAGYQLEYITVSGFRRKLSKDTLKSTKDLFVGLKDAVKVIKNFKPDIVVGTGGYVCGPIVFIASMMKIKTVIHEQNVIPGVTNKILGRFVDKILVSFDASKEHFSSQKKIVVTGNPIRNEFVEFNKGDCRRKMQIPDHRLVVTSFGGSRGAEKINEVMLQVIEAFYGREDIQIFHITGEKHYEPFMKALEEHSFKAKKNVSVEPYAHNMPRLMGASDLVISRAGAITLAEITAMALPSILIPSPYVTNNHQEHNARVLEKNGASILLQEKNLKGRDVVELINLFLKDRKRLDDMGQKSWEMSRPHATDVIYSNIIDLLNEK